MTTEIDFERRLRETVHRIETSGEKYASARALSWFLQETRKVILANETNKAEGKSVIEKENRARCSAEYQKHLELTKQAIEAELVAKATYEKHHAAFEALRSLASLERAKMQIL